jgi:CPA1 family monovalent cation:H+ antiporter
MLSGKVRRSENHPGYKLPFIIGWAGMRGVVSLASALAIPLTMSNGDEFPHRNLILFITFVVILVTLVFQGLTLPFFLKWLKVEEVDDYMPAEEQFEAIRLQLARQSVAYLEKHYSKEMYESEAIKRIREQLERTIRVSELAESGKLNVDVGSVKKLYKKVMLELINLRRNTLQVIAGEKQYDEEVLRDMEHNLDLEEARLNKK